MISPLWLASGVEGALKESRFLKNQSRLNPSINHGVVPISEGAGQREYAESQGGHVECNHPACVVGGTPKCRSHKNHGV